jgi:hypothetical protein
MTTNENLPALRLYQRTGFRLVELRPGAVDQARSRKPSIPKTGHEGIPIRDELDLVLDLGDSPALSDGAPVSGAQASRCG